MNRNDKEFLVQKIRTQYVEKENTALDELKALDKKVTRPANIFAYTLGSLSALVMGSGMSLVMTEIGATLGIAAPMAVGIPLGIVGLALALVNYPLYKKLLAKRRAKYKDEILALSNKIVNE